MSTVGRFVVKRMFQFEFRDEEFNLRASFRIVEVDTGAIRSREMADDMHRIDKTISIFGFFNIELDEERR